MGRPEKPARRGDSDFLIDFADLTSGNLHSSFHPTVVVVVSSDRFCLLVSVEFSNLVYDYSGYAPAAGYVDTYELAMFFI